MRRSTYIATIVLIAASTIGLGASASAGQAANSTVVVSIVGTNILHVNRSIETTYRFPDTIRVHQGQLIEFINKTVEAHTVTLVAPAQLPTTVAGVFNCTLCNAVNAVYFGNSQGGPPMGGQIDSGRLTDDETDHDADTPDPAVPANVRPHLPFQVLVEDFNFASYMANGHPVVGDSTVVPSVNDHVGFDARTIQVTAKPGTYHYYCTFHAWMQGTLIVTN